MSTRWPELLPSCYCPVPLVARAYQCHQLSHSAQALTSISFTHPSLWHHCDWHQSYKGKQSSPSPGAPWAESPAPWTCPSQGFSHRQVCTHEGPTRHRRRGERGSTHTACRSPKITASTVGWWCRGKTYFKLAAEIVQLKVRHDLHVFKYVVCVGIVVGWFLKKGKKVGYYLLTWLVSLHKTMSAVGALLVA